MDPDEELNRDGTVQPHLVAHLLDLGGRSGVTGHDGRRVAWGQSQKKKNDERDDDHDRDRRKDPVENISRHLLRMPLLGNVPETLDRSVKYAADCRRVADRLGDRAEGTYDSLVDNDPLGPR